MNLVGVLEISAYFIAHFYSIIPTVSTYTKNNSTFPPSFSCHPSLWRHIFLPQAVAFSISMLSFQCMLGTYLCAYTCTYTYFIGVSFLSSCGTTNAFTILRASREDERFSFTLTQFPCPELFWSRPMCYLNSRSVSVLLWLLALQNVRHANRENNQVRTVSNAKTVQFSVLHLKSRPSSKNNSCKWSNTKSRNNFLTECVRFNLRPQFVAFRLDARLNWGRLSLTWPFFRKSLAGTR